MALAQRTAGAPAAVCAVVPRATYRLQLHKNFDFDAARAVLPYLHRLGISHVYCSPVMRARPGSQHGYDVVDHALINPELGGRPAFEIFARAAKALGMGILLDQVPNHMGVFGADNAWWLDVLQNGEASVYAAYFDIDWRPPNAELHGKLLLPVLAETYGNELEHGDIVLGFDPASGALALSYHQHRFPLDPATYAAVLRPAADRCVPDTPANAALRVVADAFAALPPRTALGAERELRQLAQVALRGQLAQLVSADNNAAGALHAAIETLNRSPDRDALHALHEAQAFRLADWRMAPDEINYRRFFDVNELAALRVEDERVFEAVQGTALDLAAQGWVDGFRIDHPDGLFDPAAYFARLQEGYARRLDGGATTPGQAQPAGRPLYVVAEKIVAAAHEEIPRGWALHGTTGYRFAMQASGLFVERRHARRMERIWQGFTASTASYADIAYECKRQVARGALASQLTVLAHALQKIALADRRWRDYGLKTLQDALAEVAAAMPVYRTYITGSASAQDRRYIAWAIALARRRGDATGTALFDFVHACLLGECAAHAAPELQAQVLAFAMRFQQFSAPVAAKGVEDTAFYRYHRLVSLNEVGGDPGVFGTSASAFHHANADRAANWPHTILATSTHDSKRAEDVRLRINVLSEQPAAWRLALRRWKTATRAWRSVVDGASAPDLADQCLLHQTLLGSLPAHALTPEGLGAYRERIERYMQKAAREAKLHTSWARPHPAYEAALTHFIRGLLGKMDGNPVLADLHARAAFLAWFGALNSLAVTVLKLTCPGVPDFYQGTELIDLSLVDPDNRRPVDFDLRERTLADLAAVADAVAMGGAVTHMAETPTDGRLKMWLIWRLLGLRKSMPELFSAGGYTALRVQGLRRRHAIAFARRHEEDVLVVIVGRKFSGLQAQPGQLPIGAAVWAGTDVLLPPWLEGSTPASDVPTGAELVLNGASLALAQAFQHLPFCVLHLRLRSSA